MPHPENSLLSHSAEILSPSAFLSHPECDSVERESDDGDGHNDRFTREYCPIARTHHRFLLRELKCTQQYAPIYRCRLEQLEERVLGSIREVLLGIRKPIFLGNIFTGESLAGTSSTTPSFTSSDSESKNMNTPLHSQERDQHNREMTMKALEEGREKVEDKKKAASLLIQKKWSNASTFLPSRIIDLQVGVPAVVVGVTYKQMKHLPQFLKEYQKELLRLDGGEGSGDDNDMEDGAMEPTLEDDLMEGGLGKVLEEKDVEEDDDLNLCSATDEVHLEDSSGRIILKQVEVEKMCTGLVLAIYGTLSADGGFLVETLSLSGLHDLYLSPRPWRLGRNEISSGLLPRPSSLLPSAQRTPNYIGFLSGLSLDISPDPSIALRLHLLVDFIRGDVGSAAVKEKARRISRLVIGGNHLMTTEEVKLKKKVKLEPPDHVRLKLNDRGSTSTSAVVMTRQLDAVLTSLCETVEVELMPGDRDMSNAFLPQQPLHPVLLPVAARYSTLRLVTNPFEFTLFPFPEASEDESDAKDEGEVEKKKMDVGTIPSSSTTTTRLGKDAREREEAERSKVTGGVHFFVSAGQNVNDVVRQTVLSSRLEAMALVINSGCACPTAPNTLWSFPFEKEDPFLFPRCPHVMVACEQPRFETGWMPIGSTGSTTVEIEEVKKEAHPNPLEGTKEEEEEVAEKWKDQENRNQEKMEQMVPKDPCGRGEVGGRVGGEAVEGVRLVCVPPFHQHGMLVLVDVNSPTFETTTVDFTFLGEEERKKQK